MNLYELTAHQLIEAYSEGACTPIDVVTALFDRIDAHEAGLHAFSDCDRDELLAQAHALSQTTPHGRLWGVPVAIKDNICVKGSLTRCASRILEGFRPPYNATVIDLLQAEGAIIFAKTNMDEFAFGSSTENAADGPSCNPWDRARIPGGSSGGSAVAVAADETILALGSDTGGSIRQPASMCGVVGMKPTYGRVSRYGLIAFASSLDQIGPLAKDVWDAALLLSVIARHDKRDATSVQLPTPDYTLTLGKDITGRVIGIPKEYFIEGIEPAVRKAVEQAIDVLKDRGVRCKEISLPHTRYAVSDYYILATAEASSNLARFDGVQYGYRTTSRSASDKPIIDMYARTRAEALGDEAKRRILLGTYVLSSGYYEAYYRRAQKVRTLIKRDFDEAFIKCDCILTPTSPTTAFKIGERADDPLSMYLSDVFTISANLAGVPALSMPCGYDETGLPIGLQFMSKPFDEQTLFEIAYQFENATDFHTKKPKL